MLAALADTTIDDKDVRNEFVAIKDTVLEMKKGRFRDLFTQGKDRFVMGSILQKRHQLTDSVVEISTVPCLATPTRCSGKSLFIPKIPCTDTNLVVVSHLAALRGAAEPRSHEPPVIWTTY